MTLLPYDFIYFKNFLPDSGLYMWISEGRTLAKERGCKFIEISVAINHQLDELLVGIITQIRMKAKLAEKQRKRNSDSSRSKATCIIKRLWRRTCMTSKSCDNLHTLWLLKAKIALIYFYFKRDGNSLIFAVLRLTARV